MSLGRQSKAFVRFFCDPRSTEVLTPQWMDRPACLSRLRPLKQVQCPRMGSSLGRWDLVEARAQGTPAEVNPASCFSCPSAPSSPSARTSAITPGLRAQASKTRPWEEGRLVSQAGP